MKKRLLLPALLAIGVALAAVTEKSGWCSFGFTFTAKQKDDLGERTTQMVRDYFKKLPASEQKALSAAFELCKKGSANPQLLPLSDNEDAAARGPVYYIVPGINYVIEEMAQPFEQLRLAKSTVYFHKWNHYSPTTGLVRKLMQGIRLVAESHPRQQVNVIGYSAGGLLSLLAWDSFGGELPPNVHLETVASPVYGWGTPKAVGYLFVAPVAGQFTADIAIGVRHRLSRRTLSQCSHWVTTDCDLDISACATSDGFYPEYVLDGMPCGDDNVTYLPHLMHQEALETALARVISRDGTQN